MINPHQPERCATLTVVSGRSPSPGAARRLVAVALLGTALCLAACSSGSSTPTTAAGGSTSGHASSSITIQNFAFSPASLTVSPGATVTVTNKDNVAHTVTGKSNAFNTGDVQPGQSKTFTAPTSAGSYPYYCSIHQYMTGTLTVS